VHAPSVASVGLEFRRGGDMHKTGKIYGLCLNYATDLCCFLHQKEIMPDEVKLAQNYPNPFNPETTIKYQIAEKSPVTLRIYNFLGQEIATLVDEVKEAGFYELRWQGENASGQALPSGVYVYRLQAGDYMETRKLILLK